MTYDLVIRGAKVYDGTGAPYFYSNIGIKDGIIARMTRLPLEGERVIDAAGLSVCPGFIDPHSHTDGMLSKEPLMAAKLEQGVTSVVGGLCGESLVPTVKPGGGYRTFGEYIAELEQESYGGSMALMVGGGMLRECAMGYSADKPSEEQMKIMEDLMREAMENGALGISFGLVYPPSSYSDIEEMSRLCAIVAEYDGLAAFHLRNEGDKFYESVEEAIEIARRSGVRLILSHHKTVREPNWGKTAVTLGMIDRAAEEGIDIFSDSHPYDAMSAGLRMYIPQEVQTLGMEKLTEMARDPEGRAQLIKAVSDKLQSNTGHYKASDPPKAYILSSPTHPEYNGRRIVEIAAEQGKEFVEVVVDTLGEDAMRTVGMHVNIMGQEDINRCLKHPRVMPCTDGAMLLPGIAAHPRVRGTFARFLGRMCIRGGLLPTEAAIMKMTSLPARIYGFKNKGLLREGMDADIVVFDPVHIIDNSTVADYAALNGGINYVIVGGEIAAVDGVATGVKKGRIVRA